MGKNNKSVNYSSDEFLSNPPKDLSGSAFFGLNLDPEQTDLRDKIWSPDYDIIFCDAKAGTGKTLVSIATSYLLYKYKKYDGIVYVVSPTQEEKLGYLPGTVEEKITPYIAPVKDALLKININPETAINQVSIQNQKTGNGFIDCISHVYLRGTNFNNKIIIIDESQNMYLDEMRKTLTRVNDNCKTIVIGHSGQCDLYHHPERSGFELYRKWYSTEPRAATCYLNTNHRGWVSSHADEIDVQAYIAEHNALEEKDLV